MSENEDLQEVVEDGTDEQVEEAVDEAGDDTLETVAMAIGWNPDYEGADAKSAKEYILASREIMDTMKQHMNKNAKRVESLEAALQDVGKTLHQKYKDDVESYKYRISELEAEKKAAMRDGDVDAVEQTEKKLESAKKSEPKPPPKMQNYSQAEVTDWFTENPWANPNDSNYNPEMAMVVDRILTQFAVIDGGQIVDYNAPVTRILKKAEKDVRELFPDFFNEKPKAAPKAPAVEGSKRAAASPRKNGKGYKDLPASAKAIADEFAATEVMSREEYAKQYFKEN